MKIKLLIVFFVVYLVANTQIYAQVCFIPTNFTVNESFAPTTIAYADFNSDGILDIVVGSHSNSTIYMLFGNGLGGFGAATIAYLESNSISSLYRLISNDFNGDGKFDLAIVMSGFIGYVKVLVGDGTGSFSTPKVFDVAPYPRSICSADFNGDGKKDIAVACSSKVSILLNDNTGNFSPHIDFFAGTELNDITTGGFNGDGKIDLAVTNSSNGGPDSVWVLLGDGAGSFGTAAKYLAGSGPYSVCSADFNGDGFDDIAVANQSSDDVSVLLSKGTTGAFFNAVNYVAKPNSELLFMLTSVISADFNLDGKPDLAVTNLRNIVFILVGTDTGTFGATTFYPALYGPSAIICADFNSDGKPDLATTSEDSFSITLLLNCATAGINNLSNEQENSIYPNPVVTTTRINYKLPEGITQGEIVFFDLQGKEIKRYKVDRTFDSLLISTSDIPAGTYFYQLQTTVQNCIGKKLVVVK